MNKGSNEIIEKFKRIEIGSEGFHSWGMTDWQAEQCAEIAKQEAIGFAKWKDLHFRMSYLINGKMFVLRVIESVKKIKGVLYGEHYDNEDLYTIFKNQKGK
jgi:sulfur relay (sulfurtransferase) DsrC/TusE family protein